jgi:hypothetical protein
LRENSLTEVSGPLGVEGVGRRIGTSAALAAAMKESKRVAVTLEAELQSFPRRMLLKR